jgi:hypothetical protein
MRRIALFLILSFCTALAACDDGPHVRIQSPADGGEDCADAGDGGCDDDGEKRFGPLTTNAKPKDQESLDLFGVLGHRFWFEVSDEQLAKMNAGAGGEGPGDNGDIYQPGGNVAGDGTFADHLVVVDAESGLVADYGKIEVNLVGESSRRPFDKNNIPNLRLDMDEFKDGRRLGGFEHLRLNNSLVGSIFRETLAHRIYRALDYPALRSSWAFLGSNVWGDDVWIPMTLVEVYKRKFCADNTESIGGQCVNVWEFPGDPGSSPPPPEGCQLAECDDTRLQDLVSAMDAAPDGVGFRDALAPFIDWERFHKFQCLSWILWTGDDALHNTNNNLIIERDDGRLVWAPYSIDISMGQDWYLNTPLTGQSRIAGACQRDEECWADTMATCEALIEEFSELKPEELIDEAAVALDKAGMLRSGDEKRAEDIREWLITRQADLPGELERYRYLPGPDGCPNDLAVCSDGTCGTPEQCTDRACSGGQTWCETYQFCIGPEEFCPVCDQPDSEYFCPPSGECVADFEGCDAVCKEQNGQQWEYCEAWRSCDNNDCGGIIID